MRTFFAMILCGRLILGAAGVNTVEAQQSGSKAVDQPYSLVLTTKFHSVNHAPYSGIYVNHNPNIEMGLSYKRKQAGFFVSKNVDLLNVRSTRNFSTIGVYRSFELNASKTMTVTPYVGCFLMQANSLADTGSDLWVAVVTRYTMNKRFWLEHTVLVGNMLQLNAAPSVANRLNARAEIGLFKFDAFAWYTHSLNSQFHYVSTSLAITSPEWIISPAVSLMAQISVLQQVSDEKPEGAMNRGMLISIIMPIEFNKTRVRRSKELD